VSWQTIILKNHTYNVFTASGLKNHILTMIYVMKLRINPAFSKIFCSKKHITIIYLRDLVLKSPILGIWALSITYSIFNLYVHRQRRIGRVSILKWIYFHYKATLIPGLRPWFGIADLLLSIKNSLYKFRISSVHLPCIFRYETEDLGNIY